MSDTWAGWPEADWQSECGRIRLYNRDCLEVLPEIPAGAVDVVITSPPYNLSKKASGGGTITNRHLANAYRDWYGDEMPEEEYRDWQRRVIRECVRVCLGSVFYNHKVRYAWHGRNTFRCPSNIYHPLDWLSEFPIWCEIIWDRGGVGSPNAGRFPIADERIYQIGKPHKWHPSNGWSNVWRFAPESDPDHPCSFPVELPTRCLLPHTNPGDVAFDPFMGSGTAAIACVQTNRRFAGVEIDPHYFAVAVKRIEKALTDARCNLFRDVAPTNQPSSAGLFDQTDTGGTR